jgi:hypothetical protein
VILTGRIRLVRKQTSQKVFPLQGRLTHEHHSTWPPTPASWSTNSIDKAPFRTRTSPAGYSRTQLRKVHVGRLFNSLEGDISNTSACLRIGFRVGAFGIACQSTPETGTSYQLPVTALPLLIIIYLREFQLRNERINLYRSL